MRLRTRPLPFLDRVRPRAPFRWAAAAACLLLLPGCMTGPLPSEPAAGEAGALAEPASTRSKTATEPRKVPSCTRVWSDVLADSTWSCPDPRPPAPDFGRGG